MRHVARRRTASQQHGQALVEFSLAIIVFLVILMGVFDLGRGIFVYNGVSQAAREIARATAVHPYAPGTRFADRHDGRGRDAAVDGPGHGHAEFELRRVRRHGVQQLLLQVGRLRPRHRHRHLLADRPSRPRPARSPSHRPAASRCREGAKGNVHASPSRPRRDGERGQIVVLFTLAVVVIIPMVGLVLDGGDTFAQRRGQQNAADLGALAGANAYLNASGTVAQKQAAAVSAAQAAATRNGYTHATNGATVTAATSTAVRRRHGDRGHLGAAHQHLRAHPAPGSGVLERVGDGVRDVGHDRHRRGGGALDHEHRRVQRGRHAQVHVGQPAGLRRGQRRLPTARSTSPGPTSTARTT